jgi:hypothetical protein
MKQSANKFFDGKIGSVYTMNDADIQDIITNSNGDTDLMNIVTGSLVWDSVGTCAVCLYRADGSTTYKMQTVATGWNGQTRKTAHRITTASANVIMYLNNTSLPKGSRVGFRFMSGKGIMTGYFVIATSEIPTVYESWCSIDSDSDYDYMKGVHVGTLQTEDGLRFAIFFSDIVSFATLDVYYATDTLMPSYTGTDDQYITDGHLDEMAFTIDLNNEPENIVDIAAGFSADQPTAYKEGRTVIYNPQAISATTAVGANTSTLMGTMPAGFEPRNTVIVPVVYSPNAIGTLSVSPNGEMYLLTGSTPCPPGANIFFNLVYNIA